LSGGDHEPEQRRATSRGGGLPRWRLTARVLAALSASLLWVLVIVDHKVFELLGVHLVHRYVIRQLLQEGSLRDLALGSVTYSSGLAAVALLALGHLPVMAILERCCRRVLSPRAAGALVAAAANLVPLVLASLGGGATAARLASGLHSARQHLSASSPGVRLCYPRSGLVVPTLGNRTSVLVVVVESLRGDAWGPTLMPELFELARQGRCVASERHYSSGHETNGGLFSILYGLNACYWPEVNRARVRSWPLQVLRENGYRLTAVSAASLGGRRPSRFWMEQFDVFNEVGDHGDPEGDRQACDSLARAVRDRQVQRPFLALLFLNSTHHNYHYPPEFERFTPVLPANYDHFLGDHALARFRTQILNRYRNSVLWVDHLLAGVISDLRDDIERGQLIVVITGDHGEEFWDHGLLGHAASHLIEARTRVPFLLFAAGLSGTLGGVTSHVDILPTVLDRLQAEPPLDPAAYSDGVPLLAAPTSADRIAVVSAADGSLGDLRLVLVGRDRKLVVDAEGLGSRIELRAVTDRDDRALPWAEGARALQDILPSLREELYRFVVLQGETCRSWPPPLARP